MLLFGGSRIVLFSSMSCIVVYVLFTLCCFLVFMQNRCLFEFRKSRARQLKALSQSESSIAGHDYYKVQPTFGFCHSATCKCRGWLVRGVTASEE